MSDSGLRELAQRVELLDARVDALLRGLGVASGIIAFVGILSIAYQIDTYRRAGRHRD
jgi:hypothetical protein